MGIVVMKLSLLLVDNFYARWQLSLWNCFIIISW